MNKDYFSIIGKSGAFFVFKPHITDNPDFILVVAPGLAEHAARYARLSEFMKNHNVQLYCIDHIGHGVYTESLGIWPVDGFFECVSNMNSLVEYVRKQHPDKKVILFGHSNMPSDMPPTLTDVYYREPMTNNLLLYWVPEGLLPHFRSCL